ncbi:MAG: nicotinate (nicotinamide) nucleotide adenylyltransferase [Clostridia bacterium]|nr:nicotinate (nicotinamide) nucleotide adenylyltransferase [Clostridia bacterium]
MRIAVFGGSFDPVHTGHIGFVRAAIECLKLDKVLVMPASTPPHKKGKRLSSDSDRLEMCRLAFADVEKAEISDYEIATGGTSYTYLTCRYFRSQYPDAEIFWLVGTDMLRDFPTWKNPESILADVTLAACGRAEKSDWVKKEQDAFFARFQKKFVEVYYNGEDVSSTKIRIRAGAGLPLTGLTSEKVAAYIEEKGLYRIDGAKEAFALETPSRQAHSLRVAEVAAKRAVQLHVNEKQAIAAALFHDCAKNLSPESPYLNGFSILPEWGEVPSAVLHQYAGAYVAERHLGVTDADVLNAIRYHTSARPKMSTLEKLIFLADMIEEERHYDGVDILRELFWKGDGLDACLQEALRQTLEFLKIKQQKIYPLTEAAYLYTLQEKGTEE